MKKYYIYFAPFLLAFIFLLDGQLSTLITNLLPAPASATSHVLLLVSMFSAAYLPLSYSLVVFTLIGIISDSYYLNILGMSTVLLPLLIYIIYYFSQNLRSTRLTKVMMVVVVVFTFEFAQFILARLFGLTNLSMFIFVFYHLLPTLIYNMIILVLLQPILDRVFVITNKT